ncbi:PENTATRICOPEPTIDE REPEAT-CONTAINING PROTEIN PET309 MITOCHONDRIAL [Salix viminalis]|uniref:PENTATRICOPEPTIDE REPEAT-CONTAINING PROTEIN PET309 MITOCHONDRIAL n=1 Tax=Salix viminalis TaxID=40686 RepID=A0A9Q0SH84_SALVM|nr:PENTATRICOPEPTIDE REPEAT-CONTAINING PROTEIN PET309 MITOCHONDRIAL [Salix viminalis]
MGDQGSLLYDLSFNHSKLLLLLASCHECHSVTAFNSHFIHLFIFTSPSDNLEGLVDPNDPFLQVESRVEAFSSEEFAFLRDSLISPSEDRQRFDPGKCSNEATLIANVILNNNDGFGNQTLKLLREHREKLNPNLVVEVLNIVKIPELCVNFFIWAGRQIGYYHTLPVYNALLYILESSSKNNIDRVPEKFLREIMDDDKQVLGKLLNVLIRKCCQNGLWNAALEELGRLKDFGYKPSRLTYNALVQVFLRADRIDSAYLVHREMSTMGYSMDEFTLGCFVHSLCKSGKWREALSLLEKEEFVPDTVLYTKMISGLCEASLFEEAMDFLTRMRASSCLPNVLTYRILLCGSGDYAYAYKLLKKMVQCGCQPGYVVYNIFIGGICSNEEPSKDALDLAEKAYGEMLEAGVVLNKINIGSFSRCLCGVGKFEKAYNVIHEMMGKGFIPDTSTYSKVIGYLCNASKVEKAFQLFQEMKRNGIAPDVYVYTTLIDSFCKAGLIEQARNWFDEMERDGCVPNVVTYTALIHAYLKSRKLSKANEVYEMMLSKGCTPNIVTYTALIDGLCKAGKIEKASQIYKIMKKENVEIPDVDMYFRVVDGSLNEPNVFTYGALVDDGCCKAGKLDEAQEVFTKMLECGYDPNVFTYSSLIDRLFKDKRLDLALKLGKTDEAYKLMIMMEEKGCNPNVVTYTAMIDGFGKAGRVEKCLELMQQMSSKGCAPNFVTYRVLINHCCSAGLLDEAHKLLEEMKQTYWPRHVAGYRKVIEGFNREFITSLDLSFEISENDSVPVAPVYRVLIDNFIKAGRLEMALELNEELSSFSPFSAANQNINITLIENLSLAHKADKAFELYADMIGRGSIPELSILVHLVKGLLRVNRWEEALQLLDSICQMDIHWVQEQETAHTKLVFAANVTFSSLINQTVQNFQCNCFAHRLRQFSSI